MSRLDDSVEVQKKDPIKVLTFIVTVLTFLFGSGVLLRYCSSTKNYSLPCNGKNCPGKEFRDMPAWGTWSHDAIDWALDRGIIHGISSSTLNPNDFCSRGQILDYIYLAEGKPDYIKTTSSFSDITTENAYYDAVMWAIENKVAKGSSETRFGVIINCTREQVIAFLFAAAKKPESKLTTSPYADVHPSDWFFKAVLWAIERGIVQEDGSGIFGVGKLCTREEAITYLYRFYGKNAGG